MPGRMSVAAGAVAAGAVLVLVQRRRRNAGAGRDTAPGSRWRAVTIDLGQGDVMPGGRMPDPLAALGDTIEVEVRPAPGDKGTELRARLRSGGSGGHAPDGDAGRLRAALREAKQLIEVGEVLRVDPTPHGRRSPTPTGAAVELATKKAPKEGLL